LLATDHAELDGLLDELFAAFEAGVVRHIYQRLDLFWARLAMHIRAEHLHLFPAVLEACLTGKQISRRATAPEVARDKISALQKDHNFFMRELVSAIKQTRELLRETNRQEISKSLADVRKTIVAVKIRLEAHNELEETEVYEWADDLLAAAERGDLNEKMRRELDRLPPRFQKKLRS